MQLNEYSKYTDYVTVVQDITSSAQAACKTNLKGHYFLDHDIQLYLAFTVVIPFIVIGVFAAVIRSTHNEIRQKLTESSKYHPILAGLTLTGTYFMFFVIAMDIAALKKKHEYSELEVDNTFNLFILKITFGFDAIVFLYLLVCMMYLCCFQLHKDGLCSPCAPGCLKCLPFFFIFYFYAIFGSKTQNKIWQLKEKGDKPIVMWMITALMLAPLFSIGSHAGYILIAWVTEPDKTTAAFLIAIGSFVFTFIVFKQCYTLYKIEDDAGRGLFRPCTEVKNCCQLCIKKQFDRLEEGDAAEDQVEDQCSGKWICCKCIPRCITFRKYWIAWVFALPFLPFWIMASHLVTFCSVMAYQLCWKNDDIQDEIKELGELNLSDSDSKEVDDQEKKTDKDGDKKSSFSLKAFCMACSWGWLIIGSLAFVISAFFLVPLPTFQLAEYLENSVQVVIVVLGLVLTYKIFTIDESEIKKFMKSFRTRRYANTDDAEHAGYEVGKLADLLRDYLNKPKKGRRASS